MVRGAGGRFLRHPGTVRHLEWVCRFLAGTQRARGRLELWRRRNRSSPAHSSHGTLEAEERTPRTADFYHRHLARRFDGRGSDRTGRIQFHRGGEGAGRTASLSAASSVPDHDAERPERARRRRQTQRRRPVERAATGRRGRVDSPRRTARKTSAPAGLVRGRRVRSR